jgi:hypothetical protein
MTKTYEMTAENIRNCNPRVLRTMCWNGIKAIWQAELCGMSEPSIRERLKQYKLKIYKEKKI